MSTSKTCQLIIHKFNIVTTTNFVFSTLCNDSISLTNLYGRGSNGGEVEVCHVLLHNHRVTHFQRIGFHMIFFSDSPAVLIFVSRACFYDRHFHAAALSGFYMGVMVCAFSASYRK